MEKDKSDQVTIEDPNIGITLHNILPNGRDGESDSDYRERTKKQADRVLALRKQRLSVAPKPDTKRKK